MSHQCRQHLFLLAASFSRMLTLMYAKSINQLTKPSPIQVHDIKNSASQKRKKKKCILLETIRDLFLCSFDFVTLLTMSHQGLEWGRIGSGHSLCHSYPLRPTPAWSGVNWRVERKCQENSWNRPRRTILTFIQIVIIAISLTEVAIYARRLATG